VSTLADRQAEFCGYFTPYFHLRGAAAIGGNATQESLVTPVTVGIKDHGSDGSMQWRAERLTGPDGLQPWCAGQNIPWDTLRSQALFVMHELDHPQYASLRADLKAGTKSLETLTLNFCDAYERPSAAGREADKRIAYAHSCLSIMMRDLPSQTVPTIPGVPTMPTTIEIVVLEQLFKLLAPWVESMVSGFIKGHAASVGGVVTSSGQVMIDPLAIEKMIEKMVADGIAKIQAGKPPL
jgi:hypothetical protein